MEWSEIMSTAKCQRCGCLYQDSNNKEQWNMDLWHGMLMGFICPDCQTDEESIEAETNAATVDYSKCKPIGVVM